MKKILVIMLAIAMCFVFASCTQTTDTETPEETTAAAEEENAVDNAEETTRAAEEAEGDAEAAEGCQTIQMGNVEMDIPASWEINTRAGSETMNLYKTEDDSVEFQIEAMQTDEDVDDRVLGEMTQKYAEDNGYGEIGYNDVTVGGSIEGKIIPVDASQNPDGKHQRIYTVGKDRTIVAISFAQDDDDFTEMNKALETVHFFF